MTNGDWENFGSALADELATLEHRAMVVISDVGRAYFTQFAQLGDRLRAEAVSNHVLGDGRRLDAEAERVLADAGWHAPGGRGVDANWWYELAWPAPSARYRRLAGMAVVALRDAYRIPAPDRLVYRAWINGTPRELPLPALGIHGIGVPR